MNTVYYCEKCDVINPESYEERSKNVLLTSERVCSKCDNHLVRNDISFGDMQTINRLDKIILLLGSDADSVIGLVTKPKIDTRDLSC